MDFFLHDPNEIRLPPEEVRLNEIQITPQANNRLVKIQIELTPFIKRPNIDVKIMAVSGKEVAHTSILETMLPKLEFTMHLREPEPSSEYLAEATVYYQKLPEPSEGSGEVSLPEPMIVDQKKVTFINSKPEG